MDRIAEIDRFIKSQKDHLDALVDLQLLVAMRGGKFDQGYLVNEILSCYKELGTQSETLGNWDFSEETEEMNVYQLALYIAKGGNDG